MVEAAHRALASAVEVFARPSEYGKMVANCIRSGHDGGWARTVEQYREVYGMVSFDP
jgi:hypothetical protein